MLNVCFTFDYELFLGKNNASYEEILFNPTESIITTLNAQGVSGTFFADVCSVSAHEKFGNLQYVSFFRAQLKRMIKLGQDVQLHLHTNWLYAEKVQRGIIPGSKGYRLHDFGFDDLDGGARDIIKRGKGYLESVCTEVDKNYRCIAYRAGGFSVQPEGELFSALIDNGIIIDSSVVPYMKADTINYYNFTNVPNKLNWWVDPSKGLSIQAEKNNRSIFEVPIATTRPRLLQVIGKTKNQLSLPAHKVLGEYVKSSTPPKKVGYLERQYHRLFDYRYVSLDTRYFERIVEDLEFLYKKYKLDRTDGYVCLICHPKLADQSRVDNIRKLVIDLKKRKEKFKIVNFADIYNSIV